jgi:hypothetical protein
MVRGSLVSSFLGPRGVAGVAASFAVCAVYRMDLRGGVGHCGISLAPDYPPGLHSDDARHLSDRVGDLQSGAGSSLVRCYYPEGLANETFSRSYAKKAGLIGEIVLAQLGTV